MPIPCQDDHLRDIIAEKTISGKRGSDISIGTRKTTMIAQVLGKSLNKSIKPTSAIVQDHYKSLNKITKDVYSHLVRCMADLDNTSIDAAFEDTLEATSSSNCRQILLLLGKKTAQGAWIEYWMM